MSDKIKLSMTGVVPVYQYANLQPTVEVEADTFEEARDLALSQMKTIWDSVSEGGKKLEIGKGLSQSTAVLSKKVCDFTGASLLMDEVAHTYQDETGQRYLSGSTFANGYKAKFNAPAIAAKTAAKYGLTTEAVLSMWGTNAEASTSLGTAIHAGLELYGKYLPVSMKTKGTNEAALHKNLVLRKIVEQFYEGRENEQAMYEAFAVDKDKKLCGFIDRLLIVDAEKKIVRVQDYKTNPDVNKKETILDPFKGVVENSSLGAYWLQLSFYAYILTKAGYTVEGLDIMNYDGTKWVTYQHDVVDISAEIK